MHTHRTITQSKTLCLNSINKIVVIVIALNKFLLSQPLRYIKVLNVCLFPLLFANFNVITNIDYIFSFIVL